MRQLIGSIDQGTTSTRFIIFDAAAGEAVASHQIELEQIYPDEGLVEHDPEEIFEAVLETARVALNKAKLSPNDLKCVGITNQRETTVVWSRKTSKPVCNAIVWMDMRSSSICDEISAKGGSKKYAKKTGLPISPYFSGTKLLWILKNVKNLPEIEDLMFGTIDSWLLWKLSNHRAHITDVTNASRSLLMNLKTLDWDEDILNELKIPKSMLPQIRPSAELYFECPLEGTALFGVKISGVLGDQQAALVGQCCFDPGEAKCTFGTGCFALLNTGDEIVSSKAGLLTTVAYQFNNHKAKYALEGSVAIAGASVQWLRDNLKLIKDASEIEGLARSVENNGGCYFVPAFSGLYAPYWRDDARGCVVGLTRYVSRAHLCRATLESTAFQACELMEAMKKDFPKEKTDEYKVDGGMCVNDLLLQTQADLLNAKVVVPKIIETTALGAAYAAGLGAGVFESTDELRAQWGVDKTFRPEMSEDYRQKLRFQWAKAVRRSLNWTRDVDEGRRRRASAGVYASCAVGGAVLGAALMAAYLVRQQR